MNSIRLYDDFTVTLVPSSDYRRAAYHWHRSWRQLSGFAVRI